MVKLAGGANGAMSGVAIAEWPHMEREEDKAGWVVKHPMEEHGGLAGWVRAGGLMSGVAQADHAGAEKAEHVLVLGESARTSACGAVELLDTTASSGSSGCAGSMNSVTEDGKCTLEVATV